MVYESMDVGSGERINVDASCSDNDGLVVLQK